MEAYITERSRAFVLCIAVVVVVVFVLHLIELILLEYTWDFQGMLSDYLKEI